MLEAENKVVKRTYVVGKDVDREDVGDAENEYVGEG
jgi:hypothetical protein